jgi:type IV pilus assembly protein PilX
MQKIISQAKNEQGSVIVAALMILVLLTIIGIAATNMSTTEIGISTNSLLYERAFYAAEAGLEHAKESLKIQFVEFNDVIIRGGGDPKWDFALNGSVDGKLAAEDEDADGKGSFDDGVVWISNANLDGVNYTVTIWNNDDGGDEATDNDGLIFVRSVAVGARGERCSVEVLMEGTASGGPVSGYTAQEGAGSGKTFTSSDADAMTAGELGTQQL